jgi:hypothetical protein
MTEITAPQSEVILVEAPGEIVAIVPQPQAVIIEVRRGPAGVAGPAGPAGADGHDGSAVFPDGSATGDIIRWNAITGDWESCAEPFEFKGIVLIPMALPGAPVDGMVGFNIGDNGLYVAVP